MSDCRAKFSVWKSAMYFVSSGVVSLQENNNKMQDADNNQAADFLGKRFILF